MFRAVQYALHPFGRAGPAAQFWQGPFGDGFNPLWIFPIFIAILITGLLLGIMFPISGLTPVRAVLGGLGLLVLVHQFWLIRRLHDLGRSGAWLLLTSPIPFLLIMALLGWQFPEAREWALADGNRLPVLGVLAIVAFILEVSRWHMVQAEGDPDPNRYGPPIQLCGKRS